VKKLMAAGSEEQRMTRMCRGGLGGGPGGLV